MTVSLIPPMFIRDGEIVDNEALPSWLRPKRPSYHSGVRPANYVVTVETQLARIDATRAMLETLSETYGATPVHTAIDELLFDLRKIAVALLPAARGADIEQREDETKCQ
jgi:hypothetical protein